MPRRGAPTRLRPVNLVLYGEPIRSASLAPACGSKEAASPRSDPRVALRVAAHRCASPVATARRPDGTLLERRLFSVCLSLFVLSCLSPRNSAHSASSAFSSLYSSLCLGASVVGLLSSPRNSASSLRVLRVLFDLRLARVRKHTGPSACPPRVGFVKTLRLLVTPSLRLCPSRQPREASSDPLRRGEEQEQDQHDRLVPQRFDVGVAQDLDLAIGEQRRQVAELG